METHEKQSGTLVISLDLELYWGMFEKVSLETYGAHILGVPTVVPKMLELFSRYDIQVTWAAVGMMTCSTRRELETLLPPSAAHPDYSENVLSSYRHLSSGRVGTDETDDPYHFGGSLITHITETPGQEIGSHTFSHYYALEAGQNETHFQADIDASVRALSKHGIALRSFVFARNQVNEAYFPLLANAGVRAYRGTENHPFYRPRSESKQVGLLWRIGRFLDRYLPISGHFTYAPEQLASSGALRNVPASRQLHPYRSALSFLEPLKLWRIKRGITKAARRGELYHLWWHPHNFGVDQAQNLAQLQSLLTHFMHLKDRYGMRSRSMGAVAAELDAFADNT